MRPIKIKRRQYAQERRDLSRFLHICSPPEQPIEAGIAQQIAEMVAKGKVTRCPPGATVLPKPKAQCHRASAPIVRVAGKVT